MNTDHIYLEWGPIYFREQYQRVEVRHIWRHGSSGETLRFRFICANLEGRMRILDNYHNILSNTVFCEGRIKLFTYFSEDGMNICYYRNVIQA
jgi:hypothetical protein